MIDETTISDMLDRLAEAVSSGDLPQISACYAFPGLFMIEEKVIVFEKPAEFEKLFAEGRKWYVGQGIVEAKAEMLRFDPMADTLVGVDVRWPGSTKTASRCIPKHRII